MQFIGTGENPEDLQRYMTKDKKGIIKNEFWWLKNDYVFHNGSVFWPLIFKTWCCDKKITVNRLILTITLIKIIMTAVAEQQMYCSYIYRCCSLQNWEGEGHWTVTGCSGDTGAVPHWSDVWSGQIRTPAQSHCLAHEQTPQRRAR